MTCCCCSQVLIFCNYSIIILNCHYFTAYNFRNIEQMFTKFGKKSKSLHCEHHAVIYLNQFWKLVAPSSEYQ